MHAHSEDVAVRRASRIAQARRLCQEWGYWCVYGQWGGRGGRRPFLHGACGGIDRRYKAPPQWETPIPRMPEANEPVGMDVQRAFIQLPRNPYRNVLIAEFCMRPWLIPLEPGHVESAIARRARVSVGAYGLTLERALLALANVMKRMGSWRE